MDVEFQYDEKDLQKHILDISKHVWHWNEERFTK